MTGSLSLLTGIVLLCGSLVSAAASGTTQYFNAEGRVIVVPTVQATEAPAAAGTLETTEDGITFSAAPGDAYADASLSARAVTDGDTLDRLQAAYDGAFGPGAVLRLYQLAILSSDGETLSMPVDLSVSAFASARGDFVPARSLPFDWSGDEARFGTPVSVNVGEDVWQTTVVLPDTDLVLLATAVSGEPTETAAPAR